MDVVLGVAVTGPVARLALVGPGARGADVIDQSVVDLQDDPVGKLTETVVGTNRLLATRTTGWSAPVCAGATIRGPGSCDRRWRIPGFRMSRCSRSRRRSPP